jgi:NADH dehydrogenase
MSAAREVVIVGGGYGGVAAAARLERRLPSGAARLTMVSAADSLLMTPMLSLSAAGIIHPGDADFPLRELLPRTHLVIGTALAVDLRAHTLHVQSGTGQARTLGWNRLLLAPGSVTRSSTTPGVAELSLGAKTLQDAVAIRDHVLRQIDLAASASHPAERQRRLTFVVVGAGYSGTEFTAQMHAMTRRAIAQHPDLMVEELRWVLVHRSPRVLSQFPDQLGAQAARVLLRRGIDVHLQTIVTAMAPGQVCLSDGQRIATHTVIWTAGIEPPRWVSEIGLPTDEQGRILVDDQLAVPGHPDVFAVGDAARVPDRTADGHPAPPAATHARSQGRTAADNIAASFGYGAPRHHLHRDRSHVLNLGDRQGLGRIRGLPVTGTLGWLATYSHRLSALPGGTQRRRLARNWAKSRTGTFRGPEEATNHRPEPAVIGW